MFSALSVSLKKLEIIRFRAFFVFSPVSDTVHDTFNFHISEFDIKFTATKSNQGSEVT